MISTLASSISIMTSCNCTLDTLIKCQVRYEWMGCLLILVSVILQQTKSISWWNSESVPIVSRKKVPPPMTGPTWKPLTSCEGDYLRFYSPPMPSVTKEGAQDRLQRWYWKKNLLHLTLFAPGGGIYAPPATYLRISVQIHVRVRWKKWLFPIISLGKGSMLFTT